MTSSEWRSLAVGQGVEYVARSTPKVNSFLGHIHHSPRHPSACRRCHRYPAEGPAAARWTRERGPADGAKLLFPRLLPVTVRQSERHLSKRIRGESVTPHRQASRLGLRGAGTRAPCPEPRRSAQDQTAALGRLGIPARHVSGGLSPLGINCPAR